MAKRLFDTSYLIRHWNDFPETSKPTEVNMRSWSQKLVELHGTCLITTPVLIEMVAGTRSADELRLTHAFLTPFKTADEGRILKEDWDAAKRIAQRVPPNGKPRHLGDCLVRAISDRLHCDPLTLDKNFPRRILGNI